MNTIKFRAKILKIANYDNYYYVTLLDIDKSLQYKVNVKKNDMFRWFADYPINKYIQVELLKNYDFSLMKYRYYLWDFIIIQ